MKQKDSIDWYAQWEQFAPNFQKGMAHISLSEHGGPILRMQPGPGFGDFSHPTTRLTLSLMGQLAKNKTVIDIGCGSGVLSSAAVLLGAKEAIGIDIEEESILHSQENAKLNGVEQCTTFAKTLPSLQPQENLLIVMNMISCEQKIAWESLPTLHTINATILTSGILTTERDSYIHLTQQWNWKFLEEIQEGEWSAFKFFQSIVI